MSPPHPCVQPKCSEPRQLTGTHPCTTQGTIQGVQYLLQGINTIVEAVGDKKKPGRSTTPTPTCNSTENHCDKNDRSPTHTIKHPNIPFASAVSHIQRSVLLLHALQKRHTAYHILHTQHSELLHTTPTDIQKLQIAIDDSLNAIPKVIEDFETLLTDTRQNMHHRNQDG